MKEMGKVNLEISNASGEQYFLFRTSVAAPMHYIQILWFHLVGRLGCVY